MKSFESRLFWAEEIGTYLAREECRMDSEDEYFTWYLSPDMMCPGWFQFEQNSDMYLYEDGVVCLGGGRYIFNESVSCQDDR